MCCGQLAAVGITDTYVLWDRQDALHILETMVVNFVIFTGYMMSPSWRQESKSTALPPDQSPFVREDGLDEKQPDREEKGR